MHHPTEIITSIVLRLYKPILLATGLDHTILIGEKTYVWGRNNYGQLGLGDNVNKNSPQELPLCNIKSISCGDNYTIALTEYNILYVWGTNECGQLGLGDYNNRHSPQKLDLRVPLRIKSIVCGGDHTVVLTFSSTIYVWGGNDEGQLGLGDITTKNTPQKLILDNVESISCGRYHTIALTSQSEIYVWGYGEEGQLGLGDYDNRRSPQKLNLPLLNIKSISCGGDSTIALTAEGTLYAWGYNCDGELGLGYLDIQNEPSIVVFPEADSGDENLSRIKLIICGSSHSVAMTTSNLLYVWGWNAFGQLGLGDKIDRLRPQKFIFKNIKTIVCGVFHTIAITNTDDVYVWGKNNYGRLGLGDECDRNVPCQLKFKF